MCQVSFKRMSMIIDCISDLHGDFPVLDGGDLLILAGDYTASNHIRQWKVFFEWLSKQDYRKKVLIAGNHDGLFETGFPRTGKEKMQLDEIQDYLGIEKDFEYLCDSGCDFHGLRIWGSPWTPMFYNWHFMLERGKEIKAKWDLIPDRIDILITHGPPWGILDETDRSVKSKLERRCGCQDLREAVERVKPRLHVFGHIHSGHGVSLLKHAGEDTLCINASVMNEEYEMVYDPTRVIWGSRNPYVEIGEGE